MPSRAAEFQRKLRAAFLAEAREHLQAMRADLAALEDAAQQAARERHLESAFRHTHSLKGAARAAGFGAMEAVCHALEELFARARRNQFALSAPAFEILRRAFDQLDALLGAGERGEADSSSAIGAENLAQLRALLDAPTPAQAAPDAPAAPDGGQEPPAAPIANAAAPPAGAIAPRAPTAAHAALPAAARPPSSPTPSPPATPFLTDTVRVPMAQLDRVLVAAEEMLALRQSSARQADELAQLAGGFGEWSKRWIALQGALRQLRRASAPAAGAATVPAHESELAAFLDWNFGHVKALEGRLRTLARTAARERETAARQIEELQRQSRNLLMLPFATLGALLQQSTRELARDQDKDVEPLLTGGEVVVDLRVLQRLKDALLHLVRNAVDHGVEAPAQRSAAGKPARARLQIRAALLAAGKLEITLADDGAGIDLAAVRAAARRLQLLPADALDRLDDAQVADLVFRPDLSTRPVVTEISGHGLGLAIVREQVAALGGSAAVESRAGAGTCFRLVVPQRMAAFHGVLVRLGAQVFVLPSAQLERTVRVPRAQRKRVENREAIALDGHAVALVHLHDVLELDGVREEAELASVLVLGAGHERVAFVVDEVLHDEEVLVRRLGRPLLRVRNVAGAAVLDSGRVAPVLDAGDLLKSARTAVARPPPAPAAPAARGCRVLVAEDSITSRMLLKGILEAAGYRVRTAVDGIDAYTALRTEPFDLLVSDVEMPRLDGFGLAARVRADRNLAELPVVLVTARATREDRERGIDVGANAYIAKGGFDQRELIDTVRRLIGAGAAA